MSLSSSDCSAKATLRMFPSSSNGINYPTPFFTHIDSPNSKHEHLQLLDPSDDFFIPCYDEMISLHEETPVVDFVNNTGDNEMKEIPTAKRCSKKDRHSKINTAQGPRDRRMRLSLKVAREFFDLQDQLCFDKASKTIEWLLVQASSAIEQLSGTGTVNQNASSASECQIVEEDKETPRAAKTTACRKGKRAKPSRCPRDKNLRAEARAKARERATEKRQREEIAAQSHYFNPATSAGGSISGDQSLEAMEKWSPFPGLSHLYYPGFPQLQNEMEDVEFCKSMWE